MSHPSEAGHWYDSEGYPRYEIKGANGNLRPTTLRDAKKFGYLPSVTMIIKCAAAPGLELWKQNQVLLAALTLPRNEGELDAAYCQRILADSKEQARKAAERGTAVHAALQGSYEGKHPGDTYLPHVLAADKEIADWFGNSLAVDAEQSFAHPLGFGGKVDLHGEQILQGPDPHGPQFVVDFKTKEFAAEDDLKTWDEHAMQLAAYREGLGMPTARCAIVYVSTSVPGLARLLEVPGEDLARGWECFKSLLAFWKARNRYDPTCRGAAAA